MRVAPLTGVGWDELARAFTEAFSDYAVPMTMTAASLAAMQTRRGYVADASVGAYDGTRLIGFALTCHDGGCVYNSGTGVAPAYRRLGVARRVLDAVIATLAGRPYVLEVLEDNTRAIAFYASAGFNETRRLHSWSYDLPATAMALPEIAEPDLAAIAADADVEPAWQSTLASIARARASEPYVAIGDARGAAIVFPATGDLPLLVVRRSDRRHGHGRALLAAAAARANRPLRIMNIDARATEVAEFLAAAGARPGVRQLEMVRGSDGR